MNAGKMSYSYRLYDFLQRLSANNNRPWFQAHKAEYDELRALWMADIDRLIDHMTEWDPEMAGQSAKTSVYRIYRDTRFSPDKTPYKTFFSAALSPYGRKFEGAGYYLQTGLSNEYIHQGFYAGIWCPERPVLLKLRKAIIDNIEEWEEIVNAPRLKEAMPEWCSSMLKTVPRGWDREHPHAFYLRMKDYGRFRPAGNDFFDDLCWPEKAAEIFRAAAPFVRFLNYSLTEE